MCVTDLAENTHIVILLKILKVLGNCRFGLRSRTKNQSQNYENTPPPLGKTKKKHMIFILKVLYPCPSPTQDYIVFSVRISLPSLYQLASSSLYFFLSIVHYFPCDHVSGPDSSSSFVSVIPVCIITTAVLQFLTSCYDLRGSLKSASVHQPLIC